jgi:GT2 family glycosyltransferase
VYDAPGSPHQPFEEVDISIVVAAYCGAATIADCLQSIERATHGRRREIIVVESSGDGTSEIIQQQFPDVVLIRSAERLSAGHARNLGARAARGDLVFITDQDCVVPPDWVDRLERHLSDPAVAAAGGSVGVRNLSNLSGFALYALEFLTHFPTGGAITRNRNFLVGCNSAYRADALRIVSFPDQTLGEDVLLSNDLRHQGFDVVYDPDVEVRHQNKVGWRAFFSYNREMGRAAARYHAVLSRWWVKPFLRVPALAYLAPFVIVPSIMGRLACAPWPYFLRVLLLSPMCVLGNLEWADGFRRQVVADRAQAQRGYAVTELKDERARRPRTRSVSAVDLRY